jgi:hypothetical protein
MQKPNVIDRRRRANLNIGNAGKKLRQAEFFLSHLEQASREIAKSLARLGPDQSELLDFYFSACLSAAQSVFYTLGNAEPNFKSIEREWRKGLASDEERAQFHRMVTQRDLDVHHGETDAEPLPAVIPAESHEYESYIQHNAALLGPPGVAKLTNPDGTEISATALRGTKRLYIALNGDRVDATTACRVFIAQLRSLQDAVKAALPK